MPPEDHSEDRKDQPEQARSLARDNAAPAELPRLGKLYVVAVGVSAYRSKDLQLRFPAKDACDFVAALKKQEGRRYLEVISNILTEQQATKNGVVRAIDWLRQSCQDHDTGVLFMAGHGCNREETDHYYFLPWDAEPTELLTSAIAGNEIWFHLRQVRGRRLVVLDTCKAGNILPDDSLALTRSPGPHEDTAFISTIIKNAETKFNEGANHEQSLIIMASAGRTQSALEGWRWHNGAFTLALVEGLLGKAALPGEPEVTVHSLSRYVAQRVRELTFGRQTPRTAMLGMAPDLALASGPFPVDDFPKPTGPSTLPLLPGEMADQKNEPVLKPQDQELARRWLKSPVVWVIGAAMIIMAFVLAVRKDGPASPRQSSEDLRAVLDARASARPPESLVAPPGMACFKGGAFTMREQQIELPSFCIDKFEVTTGDFVDWLNARTGSATSKLAQRRRHPVSQVSFDQAERYCRDKKGRLPTTEEWVLAARGGVTSRQTYPWGEATPSCLGVVFARSTKAGPWSECLQSAGSGPADVGTSSQDLTMQGVNDLGGNVAEWVDDQPAKAASRRAFMGGDWARPREFCAIRLPDRVPADAVLSNVGFRCAMTRAQEVR